MTVNEVSEREIPGIRYRGNEYPIDPRVSEVIEAQQILQDSTRAEQLPSQLRVIEIMIPDLDTSQIRLSEMIPLMSAIREALSGKNAESPAEAQSETPPDSKHSE